MPKPRAPAKPGRQTLLTPETEKSILLAIAAGAPLKVAAGQAGVGETTLIEWLRRGEGMDRDRPQNELYATFAAKARQEQHRVHTRVVGTITKASLTNWSAALAWIKLRWPDVYADRLEITGAGGTPLLQASMLVEVMVGVLTKLELPAETMARARILVADEFRAIALREEGEPMKQVGP